VLEEAVVDHVARVAERRLAQALVLAQQRKVVLGADLVVQAEDRLADAAEVVLCGLEVRVGALLRGLGAGGALLLAFGDAGGRHEEQCHEEGDE
jgi:hypothetical protein